MNMCVHGMCLTGQKEVLDPSVHDVQSCESSSVDARPGTELGTSG